MMLFRPLLNLVIFWHVINLFFSCVNYLLCKQGIRRIRQFRFPRQIIACNASKRKNFFWSARVSSITIYWPLWTFQFTTHHSLLSSFTESEFDIYFYRNDVSATHTPKNFKQKREEERKASEASGDTRAWNSFFMRSDTVCFNLKRIVHKYSIVKLSFDDFAVCTFPDNKLKEISGLNFFLSQKCYVILPASVSFSFFFK